MSLPSLNENSFKKRSLKSNKQHTSESRFRIISAIQVGNHCWQRRPALARPRTIEALNQAINRWTRYSTKPSADRQINQSTKSKSIIPKSRPANWILVGIGDVSFGTGLDGEQLPASVAAPWFAALRGGRVGHFGVERSVAAAAENVRCFWGRGDGRLLRRLLLLTRLCGRGSRRDQVVIVHPWQHIHFPSWKGGGGEEITVPDKFFQIRYPTWCIDWLICFISWCDVGWLIDWWLIDWLTNEVKFKNIQKKDAIFPGHIKRGFHSPTHKLWSHRLLIDWTDQTEWSIDWLAIQWMDWLVGHLII